MGRAFTTTGISISTANNNLSSIGSNSFNTIDGGGIKWGEGDTQIYSQTGTPGTVLFDALDKNFRLETDSGTIHFYTNREVKITVGTGNLLKVVKDAGGTLMTLNGNTGDLKIAGTLGTGVSF